MALRKAVLAEAFDLFADAVDEFLLVEQAGFEALGLVMGSSIYHVGFQWQKWSVSQELVVLTNAMFEARELAMTRMEEEAEQLGANVAT